LVSFLPFRPTEISKRTYFKRVAVTLGETTSDVILSQFQDGTTGFAINPYIGDYQDLEAIGNQFFGTFCASNDPDRTHFPSGIYYQRYIRSPVGSGSVAGNKSLTATGEWVSDSSGTDHVSPSNDPFFFRVDALRPPISIIASLLQFGVFEIRWQSLSPQSEYRLESTSSLADSTAWSPVDKPLVLDLNGDFNVTLRPSEMMQYFRLRLSDTNRAYTVDVGSGSHGVITPRGSISNVPGQSLAFAALPDLGYQVDRWYLDGKVQQIGGTNYTLLSDSPHNSLTVIFTPEVDLRLVYWVRPVPMPEEYPGPLEVIKGGNVVYTLTVVNSGSIGVTNIVLIDNLPANIGPAAVASTGAKCSQVGNTISCVLDKLLGGESSVVQITVTPPWRPDDGVDRR
jgi:uncharacterized repeat protein (TIGR01451 family)